jgi:hypothetical protein
MKTKTIISQIFISALVCAVIVHFVTPKYVRDSVLISKFCIGKIGHFNKREKENGLAHEI